MPLTIHVYHREPMTTGDLVHVADIAYPGRADDRSTFFANRQQDYEMALNNAWRRTQNIDGSWSMGERFEDGAYNEDYSRFVTRVAPLHVHDGRFYGLRSSAVGDVFEIDGKRWEVASVGFRPLDGG